MIKYVLIPESTINAYKISNEHVLSPEDIAKIVVNKDLIRKFIEQKAVALQFDIWAWVCKWEEHIYLKVVEKLAEIAKEVWNIKQVYEEYIEELNKNKE